VQDANPPNDQQDNAGDRTNLTGSSAPGLGPASALLRLLLGDQIPAGPLGPDNVPASVLSVAVAIATEELVNHAKRCQNPNCPHLPPPLLLYRRGMRPDAFRKVREQVHSALWTHPDHDLVTWVRKQIVAKYPELSAEISAGTLLNEERLGHALRVLGTDGPRVIAAVLWARKFEGPHAEDLFRSLVPLAQDDVSRRSGEGERQDVRPTKDLGAEVRKLSRELKETKHSLEQAHHAVEVKDRVSERFKRDLETIGEKYRNASKELDRLKHLAQETDAAHQATVRDAEKASKVNGDLRRELRRSQEAQRDVELERSDLARQLAALRRDHEHLKLQFASVPKGLNAIMDVLRAEEDRIQKDRKIKSGGAKVHADEEWTAYRKLEKAFLDAHPEFRTPPPIKIRPKVPLRLVALGGSGEVGRSCYLLELGKHRILVDCGIKPGSSVDLHPDIDRLNQLDALVLTHAHTDHVGWVPALVRRFGKFDIYCSEGTAALLPVMLQDCRQHYIRKLAIRQEQARYISNAEVVEDAYDDADMHAVPNLAITCRFGETEVFPFGDASIRFYRAGHILGASSVLIEDQSGRRIFFSGDFSSFPQLTVPAASWPEDLGEIDLLVLESTYGSREHHKPLEDSRGDLVSFIRQTLETREGSVILASFGLGRAQELLKMLVMARQDGLLPSVPINVDGMIKQINPIYRKHADFAVAADAFNEVSGETEREEIAHRAQREPSIIVTTSGMLTGGPVVEYARRLLPDARNRIVLTGYQDEGAPTRTLRELTHPGGGPRVVEITDERGGSVKFEAAMRAKEVGLSAHADRAGLIEYAKRLRPATIALVHGEPAAQEELRFRLSQTHGRSEIVSAPSELELP